MALSSLRLRRALPLSAPFLKLRPSAAALPAPPPSLPWSAPLTKAGPLSPISLGHCATQRLSFGSSAPLSDRRGGGGEDRKFDPDEILFEGCDYNHWLITMDFPKDPKPTPEEMVETYVQTLAKVVGSVEEAKKRMYACSTTTYTGFQAVMTEEMSEKFRGLPGVVFILPDSYIDPINKEYGGDKYDNGVITPRPPPVQYRRQGRYDDRNRNYGQPRHDRQRDMQQGNPSYDRQGPPQGEGRNFAPQQNFGQDRQGYGPPGGGNFAPERRDYGQGERRDYVQAGGRGNFPGGRDGYHGERRDSTPAYQAGVNMGRDGNLHPREQRDFSQAQRGNFPPQGPGNFPPQGPGSFPQGQHVYGGSDYGQSVSSSSGGAYQQDASAYGQNNTGSSGQNYGQNYQGPQTTPHIDHWDGTQSEQRNSTYPAQTGTQGRF